MLRLVGIPLWLSEKKYASDAALAFNRFTQCASTVTNRTSMELQNVLLRGQEMTTSQDVTKKNVGFVIRGSGNTSERGHQSIPRKIC